MSLLIEEETEAWEQVAGDDLSNAKKMAELNSSQAPASQETRPDTDVDIGCDGTQGWVHTVYLPTAVDDELPAWHLGGAGFGVGTVDGDPCCLSALSRTSSQH